MFFIARPIRYDEIREHKLARLENYHTEVVNGNLPWQSVGQPFLSNLHPAILNDSFNSDSEYDSLLGVENDLIFVAFRGKFLVNYDLTIDSTTNNSLNADLRIIKRDSQNPKNELDVRAWIPEEKILAKLYQIPSFGVKVPKEVNLNLARKLPTKPRLEYINDKVEIKTVNDAHTAFLKHLNNGDTDVFFSKFGEKYDTEDSDVEVFDGFYAFNPKTKNMMFFREEATGTYKLAPKKATHLKKTHQLLD